MKKALFILFTLLFGLVSCVEPLSDIPQLPKAEETGLVAVTMELEIPAVQLQAFTKAVGDRSEKPSIKDIRVAVFGISGYPQAYSYAEPVDADGNPLTSYATENAPNKYYFKVLLPIYDGEAHVHIIANGDESIQFVNESEISIMETMKTQNNVGAFWARVVLPEGILPEKDENGIMTTDTEGNFRPSPETAAKFENLTLIRNFAEVLLINEATNLTNVTWTLVNIPNTGSVAPMDEQYRQKFVDDFKNYTYNATTGTLANGNAETGTNNHENTYEGFDFPDDLNISVPSSITTDSGTPLFMYERKYPGSQKPTCILVRGTYVYPDGTVDSQPTYYRIDLMNEDVGGYFPIYRNFKYQVKIHKVGNHGSSTPEEAMLHESGGNVSMTPEAQSLTDISDGESRLYVEYVEKNFVSGGKKTLWVQYVPDVSTGTVDNSNVSISVKTEGDALNGTTITELPTSSQTGYKIYEFTLNDQSETKDLTSVLQVTAHNGKTGEDKSTLYRDINLRVMKKMNMKLSLVPKKVDTGTGKTTILNIGLPAGLPSSMFPLEIYIEDINHTINPTGATGIEGDDPIDVPVKVAKSLADETTSSFYFIRTVNESEYLRDSTISTQFTTIANASATTIYVANEYFKTQSINLLNDGVYVNPVNATVDFNVTSMEVQVEMFDQTKTWTVSAGSGVTVNKSGTQTGNGTFTMTFTANNSTTASVPRTATVTSGGVSHTVTITQLPLHFSITPATQDVLFSATSANVTVNAPDDVSWTVSVNNGATLVGASADGTVSGTGSQAVTVNFTTNGASTSRTFRVTATMSDPTTTSTADIVQGRGPSSPSTFSYTAFMPLSNGAGQATSTDGFVTVSLANCSSTYVQSGWSYTEYIRLGTNQRGGTLTVTPSSGVKITKVVITYYNSNYADPSPTISAGYYGLSGVTGTWTIPSDVTGPVTLTSTKYGNNQYCIPYSYEVYYEAL